MAEATPAPTKKRCGCCKRVRLIKHFDLSSRLKDKGYRPTCKACRAKQYQRRMQRDRNFQRYGEQLLLELPMKACARCKLAKASSEFHRSSYHKSGLKPYCRPCMSAHVREYYEASPEQQELKRRRGKAWKQANQERIKATNKAWRQANIDRVEANNRAWRAANPDKVAAQAKAWHKAHPDWVRAKGARWRALRKGAQTVRFTAADLAQRWAYYGNKCWLCGDVATATDHVKPLSKGGPHMLCNLRPICLSCNSRKQGTWPFGPEKVRDCGA